MMIRLVGMLFLVLANAAVFSLADAKPASFLHYTLLGFVSLYFVFCYVALVYLEARMERLEKG